LFPIRPHRSIPFCSFVSWMRRRGVTRRGRTAERRTSRAVQPLRWRSSRVVSCQGRLEGSRPAGGSRLPLASSAAAAVPLRPPPRQWRRPAEELKKAPSALSPPSPLQSTSSPSFPQHLRRRGLAGWPDPGHPRPDLTSSSRWRQSRLHQPLLDVNGGLQGGGRGGRLAGAGVAAAAS
jgi:hypothetical protein